MLFYSAMVKQNTYIGPIPTLAPEVYSGEPYTNKIDVWAWAYASTETLGYRCPNGLKKNGKVDTERHAAMNSLRTKAATKPELARLTNLFVDMLSWSPNTRPSVDHALKHPCWDGVGEEEAPAGSDDVLCAKRIRTSDKDILPAGDRRLMGAAPVPASQKSPGVACILNIHWLPKREGSLILQLPVPRNQKYAHLMKAVLTLTGQLSETPQLTFRVRTERR